jgi:hypothetical protein
MEQAAPPLEPVIVRNRRSRKSYTGHALLRFLERSTRVPVDNFYFALLKARHADGLFEEPSDDELLAYISRGNSLDKFKRVLSVKLDQSKVIHTDKNASYRAIGNRLIAVMNGSDSSAVTILTAEQAGSSVPQQAMQRHGVLKENPHPTLRPAEVVVTSRCLFKIERRQADRARPTKLIRLVQSIEPEMEILSGRGTLCLVVVVHSRRSLDRLSEFSGLTVTPYFPSERDRRLLICAERERFPNEDWDEVERKSGYTIRPPRRVSTGKRWRSIVMYRVRAVGGLIQKVALLLVGGR